ncbi:hypothetical protein ACCS78_11475, partial [Rhizobium johnstonii]
RSVRAFRRRHAPPWQYRDRPTGPPGLSQLIRLSIDGLFDPKEAPAGLVELVCRAGDCPDIKTLEAEVKRLSKAVRKIFLNVVKA